MQIKQNEIINRIYVEKQPIAFEYILKDVVGIDGKETEVRFWFEKLNELGPTAYKVTSIIFGQLYVLPYNVPKLNMDLTEIVGIGLYNIGRMLADEAFIKQSLYTNIFYTTSMDVPLTPQDMQEVNK